MDWEFDGTMPCPSSESNCRESAGFLELPHTADLDLSPRQISELASGDAVAGFLNRLGYDTSRRTVLAPEAIGLAGDSASALKRIELLSENSEQFRRVVFAQPRSLTAKGRNDLARVLGKSTVDHLLVLLSDFDTLEFVLLDKRKRESKGPVAVERIQIVPKVISVNRRVIFRFRGLTDLSEFVASMYWS